jgi:hypothetical protein
MVLLVFLFLVVLFSCSSEEAPLTETVIKSEILEWWGAKIFEGVVIDDTVRVGKTYEVAARMVVCFDTLEQMTYVFKRYRRGWRVWRGPVDQATKVAMIKEMLTIPLNTAKNNIVMGNMRELERAVMQFAVESDGRYPANFTVKAYEMSYNIRELLGPYLKNPYIPRAPAVIMARGDTSEWFAEYEGKVVYFPLNVDFDGIYASGFIIKGSSDRRFLKHVVKSREDY